MNIQSLYYFIAAAQDLNLTFTARRLYVTQQALSDQIRKLEKRYDAVFFERRPRLRLTWQGEQMLDYARSVVRSERELAEKLRAEESAARVRLRIAAPSDSASATLPHILKKYLALHPNAVPEVFTGTPEALRGRLEEERIDVYFGPYRRLPASYAAERLTRDYLYFMISRELLAAVLGDSAESFIEEKRAGISPAEACRFPIALPPSGTPLRTAMEIACMEQGAAMNAAMETSSNDMMFDICSMGLCSSFVMRELLFARMKQGRLPEGMLFFPASGMSEGTFFCAAARRGTVPEYVSDFMKCCRETLQEIEAEMDSRTENGFYGEGYCKNGKAGL